MVGRTARLLGLALLVAGCGSGSGVHLSADGLVDDSGVSTILEHPARRIVSLIPATTEWLFAIGADPQLVGRSDWCDYPAAVLEVPSLGNGIEPNLEAIVDAKPDLVLLYQSQANAQAAARLRALKIPVLLLATDRLADMERHIGILGVATGREEQSDSVVRDYRHRMDAVTRRIDRSDSTPTVLLLAWDQPAIVLGKGSFLSELITFAGASNAFGDLSAPSATVSIEAIAARDPDLLLTTSDGPPAIADRPEWKVVKAIQEGRYLRVEGSKFNRPSPRAPEAVQELVEAIAALVGQ